MAWAVTTLGHQMAPAAHHYISFSSAAAFCGRSDLHHTKTSTVYLRRPTDDLYCILAPYENWLVCRDLLTATAMLLITHALFTHITLRSCHTDRTTFAVLIGRERSKVGRRRSTLLCLCIQAVIHLDNSNFKCRCDRATACHMIGSHHFCISFYPLGWDFPKRTHIKGKTVMALCVRRDSL